MRSLNVISILLIGFLWALSLLCYNNYTSSEAISPILVARFIDNDEAQPAIAGILETIAAEKLQLQLEQPTPSLFRDLGTQLNKMSLKGFSLEDWNSALTRINNSFPNYNTQLLISIFACYGQYLNYTSNEIPVNQEPKELSQLFDIRKSYFGELFTRELFYSEWILSGYSEMSPLFQINNQLSAETNQKCRLTVI